VTLQQGRDSYTRHAWTEAFESLSGAEESGGLDPEDLELLATAAYMLGRNEDHLRALERAHQTYLEAGEPLRAARCAFWEGMHLALQGEMGRATGWLGRAQRLVEREGHECVEQGYLLMPGVFKHEGAGEYEQGAEIAARAAAVGERFGDADLVALARHVQGHMLVMHGRVSEGLALLDEAMVAVTTRELSPIVSGIVYCGVIMGCADAYEPRRAQQWTAALERWWEAQPDMVAFTGRCLLHRAEIMQLRGAWPEALEEAARASERSTRSNNVRSAGEAAYLRAEVHRLRGELAAASDAYREASRCGREPQPGLALLRLAQGDRPAAAGAIRRVVGETSDRLALMRLLPAHVEIMLAVGEVEEARDACARLEELSAGHESGMLGAMVAQARGAVDLAAGDAGAALLALRPALRVWQELEAPYEAARARVLLAQACRALGDGDGAALELEAARDAFEELGAAPDIARTDSLAGGGRSAAAHGLTPRELEVLRLVAAGATNKAIAAELVLSERTVDRHVSNIFGKLRVSSRAAATAYAYENRLV
jgi:DNA-binding CsgD family transcriptional regulator